MGLAPYGRPHMLDRFRRLIRASGGFGLALEPLAFDWTSAEAMYRPVLAQWLQTAPRRADEPLRKEHCDIAASLQARLEEILVQWAVLLAARTGRDALALAGGVAHNSAAIGAIRRSGAFAHLFVQPAAGDAGTAIGAAVLSHAQRAGAPPVAPLPRATLGCAPEAAGGLAAQLAARQQAARRVLPSAVRGVQWRSQGRSG